MTDAELMQSIKAKWGDLFATAGRNSSVAPAFLAALTANESTGNPAAQRFESKICGHLVQVLLNRETSYGSIDRNAIVAFAQKVSATLNMQTVVAIDQLSTSWGLLQIMGYEVIALHADGLAALQTPASEIPIGCRMLADFATRYGLDPSKDFSQLFDCWNTGRPGRPTFDPQYIPNGLQRMQIYQALP